LVFAFVAILLASVWGLFSQAVSVLDLWGKHNLDAIGFFVLKDPIHVCCLLKRHAVCDKKCRVDLIVKYVIEQPRQILMNVRLPQANLQSFTECRSDRDFIKAPP
jgi:hypothetical protein